MSELPAWAKDPDAIERVFMAAVGEGDAVGVEAAIRLMLVADPARAVRLWDGLRIGLRVVDLMRTLSGDVDDATLQRLLS